MQTEIPTGVSVWIDVGNICATVRPLDLIAFALHQLHELFLADGVLHALVDLNSQSYFPALAAHGCMILGLLDTRGLLLLRLADGQTVTHTDLVREFSELRQIVFFEMQFPAVFKTDRVDNEVRMDVLRIGVGSNDNFVVLPLLRQLQRNGMCFLRCDVFIRVEGLHEMKIHFLTALVVLQLRADELCVADLRLAVNTCDQLPTFELRFLILFYIVQHNGEPNSALSFRTVDGCDCCHGSHLPLQNLFQQFLDLQIEFIGFADVDRTDPSRVRQCCHLIEIRSLSPKRTGAIIETIDMYDLFPDGAGSQILCEIHPRGLCVPSDGIRVSFCHIEGQRNGFCAIGFFLQYGTSIAIKWVRASARKGDAEGSSRPPTGGREQSKAMLAPSSRREILLSAVNTAVSTTVAKSSARFCQRGNYSTSP